MKKELPANSIKIVQLCEQQLYQLDYGASKSIVQYEIGKKGITLQ